MHSLIGKILPCYTHLALTAASLRHFPILMCMVYDLVTYLGKPLEPPAGLEPAIPGLLTFTADKLAVNRHRRPMPYPLGHGGWLRSTLEG